MFGPGDALPARAAPGPGLARPASAIAGLGLIARGAGLFLPVSGKYIDCGAGDMRPRSTLPGCGLRARLICVIGMTSPPGICERLGYRPVIWVVRSSRWDRRDRVG
ncbi:hypothetical protein NM688_g9134 [Phlebia brevispora]|uniref:Uncharacterized protein n=1 Tax=Phlebia brevispora TaxID=194682 RepID=A0ACC1RMJ8_9APHY|nr:hypothetical protein NM688_g9134 [Phlebia brevispora]